MSARRRWHLAAAVLLMFVGAFAELLTIGAILPFLVVISDPGQTGQAPELFRQLRRVMEDVGGDIVVTATILLISVALIAAIIRISLAWVSQGFVLRLGHELGLRIYSRVIRQPYAFHALRNSSEVIAGVEKVNSVIFGVLLPLMQGFTSAFIALFIVAALFVIDAVSATIAAVAMGAIYVGVSLVASRTLDRNSKLIAAMQTARVRQIQEGLGGIREIIIDQSQPVFEDSFRVMDDSLRRAQAMNVFLAASPRFVVEAGGIVLIALLALYLSQQPGGIVAAIPILGALALGAQRLLPLLQHVYVGWSQASANRQNLIDMVALLEVPVEATVVRNRSRTPVPFQNEILFENVSFRYAGGVDVLKNINLRIPQGGRIGFVGETGSGKSTIADLLMGLLEPTRGTVYIDGRPLDHLSRAEWQGQVAHVSQAIYLSDSSIAANIAFGKDPDDIDIDRVRLAARQAEIDAFITTLPQGYHTPVGERGVRLSGGQHQRIGIARALYKRANVLVFDEATSALDYNTETAIVRTIAGMGRELTLIMIAHRLTTLADCETIVRLSNGRIEEIGSYQQVIGRGR